ncbi:zinc finger HIT domain-containing protein 1 [Nematostella vectensis]|uniref:zinc finger HIT domain-containing protein 1 n=1 Tax=Nematostella vectensis TaxID=45351 RepID=UPI00138FFF36|nr:zinc finger HIT domain-containing protein 1 [Nematostella vectensis]
MAADRRESGRIKDAATRKILDTATRRRRQKRQLESLENDNFQEDPHAHLTVLQNKMRIPAFKDTMEEKRKKKKTKTGEHFKQRFKRTFAVLLEEAQQETEEGQESYASANVPPSRFPERHFCSVCGFPSNYTCVSCGARYCCVKCLGTHQDTRCLKWTV